MFVCVGGYVSFYVFFFSTLLPLLSLLFFTSTVLSSIHFFMKELKFSLQNWFFHCQVKYSLLLITLWREMVINCSQNYSCVLVFFTHYIERKRISDVSAVEYFNMGLYQGLPTWTQSEKDLPFCCSRRASDYICIFLCPEVLVKQVHVWKRSRIWPMGLLGFWFPGGTLMHP